MNDENKTNVLKKSELNNEIKSFFKTKKLQISELNSIYSNTNYREEIKLVPIIMDYCLRQFDALIFFLGVRLHGGYLPNFIFFNVNLQIFR